MVVLITGGTGTLGKKLVQIVHDDLSVRVLSRTTGSDSEIVRMRGDLTSGEGLAEALVGVDVVVHLATSPASKSKATDVEGTKRLVAEARRSGVKHFIYPSIAGIEEIPFAYYRNKLEAEKIITESGIPYTILRTTQFHAFIHSIFASLNRLPVALIPRNFKCQSVDESEVAERLYACIKNGPLGHAPAMGGPEVLTFGEMFNIWLQSQSLNRKTLQLPIPGKFARSIIEGKNTLPDSALGQTTWQMWLEKSLPTSQ